MTPSGPPTLRAGHGHSTSSGEGSSDLVYLAEYIWQALGDLLVRKTQDTNATLRDKLRTLCIMCRLLRAEVNGTIDFNSQLMFDTKQVENELSVRMLPSRFKVHQLPITQG
jgi:hypothetical protein